MRVLLVAPQPYYSERGTPIGVYLRCHAYRELGIQVDLFTYPMGEDRVPENTTLHRLPSLPGINDVPIGASLRKLLLDLMLLLQLALHLWSNAREYAFIDAFEEAAIFTQPLGSVYGLPVVYDYQSDLAVILSESDLYGYDVLVRAMGSLEGSALGASSALVCMAESFREDFDEEIDHEKIFPIEFTAPEQLNAPPSPSSDQLRELKEYFHDDRITLGYVGSLESYQNLDLLLEGLAQTSVQEELQVLIGGGSGSRLEALRTRTRELDLEGTVDVLGWLEDPVRIELLRRSDVLFSGRVDGKGVPIKVYTYMWLGKPLLLADGECHRALFGDEDVLWSEPSVEGFRRTLTDLPNADRKALSDRTEALFESEYDFDCFVKKHRPLVDYVINAEGSDR